MNFILFLIHFEKEKFLYNYNFPGDFWSMSKVSAMSSRPVKVGADPEKHHDFIAQKVQKFEIGYGFEREIDPF